MFGVVHVCLMAALAHCVVHGGARVLVSPLIGRSDADTHKVWILRLGHCSSIMGTCRSSRVVTYGGGTRRILCSIDNEQVMSLAAAHANFDKYDSKLE